MWEEIDEWIQMVEQRSTFVESQRSSFLHPLTEEYTLMFCSEQERGCFIVQRAKGTRFYWYDQEQSISLEEWKQRVTEKERGIFIQWMKEISLFCI